MRNASTTQEFESAPPEQAGNGLAGFAFAWRRKGLIVFTVIAGLGLGYIFFVQQRPVYQSSSQILIVQQRAKLPIKGLEVSPSYDSTHGILIRSPIVVQKAINKYGLRRLTSLRDSNDAVATLMAGLSTNGLTSDGGSRTGDVIELTYESSNREDCPKILDAVVKAYQEFLGDLYQNVSEETSELITEAKDQLDREITAEEEAYRKFRSRAPLLFTGEVAENVHETRLIQIESVRSEAIVENSMLQAKIESLIEAKRSGAKREVLNLMIGHISKAQPTSIKSSLPSIDQQVFPLLVEEQMLLEQYGIDNPKVQAIQKRIRLTRKFYASTHPKEKEPQIEPTNGFETYIESLRIQEKMNRQAIEEMNRLFETERAASKLLANDQVTDQSFRSKIERKSHLFDVVLKRLEEINLVKDSGGAKVQIIYPPTLGKQFKPTLGTIMLTSGILSVLCGLVLGFIVDSADHRYRNPDEIRNELSVPVIGHIPTFRISRTKSNGVETPQLAPELRTVHSPDGNIAEAYRSVRTSVCFSTRTNSLKVIQVTSPHPGDGRSTMSANLAISIANAGKSVVLIDADFRNPCCHKLFHLDNRVGMTSVIEGETELTEAIQQTSVENLSLLTSGMGRDNSSELLTSRRFEELLDQLRQQFEMVIVDSPSVLVSCDSLNVAARVDGVLVLLKLSKRARNGSRRTVEALEEVGASVLGVVVNGVESNGSGYGGSGYGQYRYHYGVPIRVDKSDDRNRDHTEVVDDTEMDQESGQTPHDTRGKKGSALFKPHLTKRRDSKKRSSK